MVITIEMVGCMDRAVRVGCGYMTRISAFRNQSWYETE